MTETRPPGRWHVSAEIWCDYRDGSIDPVLAAAVDAHVQRCPQCRASALPYVDAVELDHAWRLVATRLSATPKPMVLRWLPDRDAVPLSASALGLPWAVAVGTAMVAAVVTGLWPARGAELFLLLGPLVPVLSVVAAFDAGDPLRELVATTPYSKLRLAMLRSAAALTVALPMTGLVGWLVPALAPVALTWLLPGLALTATTLLLLGWLDAWRAAGVVSLSWCLVVGCLIGWFDVELIAVGTAQLVFILVALAATTLFVLRTATTRLEGGY